MTSIDVEIVDYKIQAAERRMEAMHLRWQRELEARLFIGAMLLLTVLSLVVSAVLESPSG